MSYATLDDLLNALMKIKKQEGGALMVGLSSDEEGNAFSTIGNIEVCDLREDEEDKPIIRLVLWPSGAEI